jgi:sugar phosphate isomerase/epimerase
MATASGKDISGADLDSRLKALSDSVKRAKKKSFANKWINLHIHTNESFSYFSSPSEAVWNAFLEDVFYFGINDHYSIDGHAEFRAACRIAGLRDFYSIEAIALDAETREKGRRFNDPNNPGRIYIIGKGVVRDLVKGSREEGIFDGMKDAIRKRNVAIVEKMNAHCREKGIELGLGYEDARGLTPHGNTTERHVVQAFCEKIARLVPDPAQRLSVHSRLLGVKIDESTMNDSAELHTAVRAHLVKSGKPCYVEENERAFTSIQNLVRVFRQYGTVPTYGVMGNPITEEEEDLEALMEKVTKLGMYGLDLFEFRTRLERAAEIIDAGRSYGLPVYIGTEHNTKTAAPLTGEIGRDPRLYPYLRQSAEFARGHQLLEQLCDFGYLDREGRPRFANLGEGFGFYSEAGKTGLGEGEMEELMKRDIKERRKRFGI